MSQADLISGIQDVDCNASYFDQPVSRRGTDSDKWDDEAGPGELPMTIADMDFRTSPAIIDALTKKVETGVFGYEVPGDDYYNAVAGWMSRRHGFTPQREWMCFVTGVVPAISSLVRHMSNLGDNVLLLTPIYNIFFNSILNNGRHALTSQLVYDRQKRSYSINWADLEAKMADPLTTLMIVCNPHNPIGFVLEPEDLARMVRLAANHHVTIISDEIHGDLVLRGEDYTPLLSLPEPLRHNVIELVSPSKTFNVAALHAATAIIADEGLRERAVRGFNQDEIAEPNLAAIPGTIAAYTKSDKWYRALLSYLKANVEHTEQFLASSIPQLVPVHLAATYLVWIDCSDLFDSNPLTSQECADLENRSAGFTASEHDALSRPLGRTDVLCSFIRQKTGLIVTPGRVYGAGGDFIRMALACPRAQVDDALDRLARGVEQWKQTHPAR
jgi:cystathionine beta-lyase